MEYLDWSRLAENGKWRRGAVWNSRYNALMSEEDPPRLHSHRDTTDDSVDLIAYFYALKSPKFYLPVFFALRITLFVALPLMVIGTYEQERFPAYFVLGMIGIMDCKETVGEQVAQFILSSQMSLLMGVWGTVLHYLDVLYHPNWWWFSLFISVFLLSLLGEVFVVPFTMTSKVDESLRAMWKDIGRIVRSTAVACWSHDSVEVMLALSRTSTEPLYKSFITQRTQLVSVMYEVWESTLRFELRKERLEIGRQLVAYLHGMASSVRSLHLHQRAQQAQPQTVKKETFNGSFDTFALPVPSTAPTNDTAKHLRNYLYDPLQAFLDALDAVLIGLGDHLDPHKVAENVQFDDLRRKTSELQSAIDQLHFDTTAKGTLPEESAHYISVVFSHLMMVLLGEEILKYGDQMRNFNRSRYKSTSRRIAEFFFLDYWNSFWSELPKRLTLARDVDVRLVKDGIKVALAYTVGVMYTLYIDPVNVFYFGMAILIGVSFPTAGESLMSGVQRVAGAAFGASIAFVARHKFDTTAAQLAIALSGIFLALYTRNFTPYLHISLYTALTIVPNMQLVETPLIAFSRLVINSFSVMSYYAIVVFIFPIDTIKVLHNKEVRAMEAISDTFSDLLSLVLVPLEADDEWINAYLGDLERRRDPLCRAVHDVPAWIPRAAQEPIIRGIAYPAAAQEQFMPVLRRLAASVDIIRVGLARIHRSRTGPPEADAKKVFLSVAPLIRCIDRYRCRIMQDFIDAVQKPLEWSAEQAASHFSVLLQLNLELEEAFASAHAEIISLIQKDFQMRLLRRANAIGVNLTEPFNSAANQLRSGEGSLNLMEEDLTFLKGSIDEGILSPSFDGASIKSMEREDLTGPRNPSFMLRPDEFTINHDVNMSIAILVGIDMFCNELDKLLSVMFQLNQFERSRFV